MALSKDELAQLNEQLRQQAELQKRISESAGDYLKLIKDIKLLQKDISHLESSIAMQSAKVTNSSGKQKEIEEEKLRILEKELQILKKTNVELVKAAKETSALGKSMAVFKEVKKDVVGITNIVKTGYGKMKNWAGLFGMDKSLKMSALNMGILSKQTDGFRANIRTAANSTIDFGLGIEEISKLQSDYSDELGRSVILTQEGLKSMGAMAAATGLGAEGAAKFAADMDNVGYSAERTKDFVEQTMNDAHKMGLNASKVVKNISANIKMLNKYNFKGGSKGLAKMAETATKLGVDMNIVSGMADKLFDIEGAVDMSSQLQVMGGEWSKLADPFKLMYMARNDMEGLTEAMGKAAEGSVHFNNKSKEFEISAMEMHKLRKIAEQTGVSYEELAQMGKNAAKFTKIKSQISFTADEETKEFLANSSNFDEKGNAFIIDMKGDKKYLNQLKKENVKILMNEKATLEQRAKDSQTFDERITNLIRQFKQQLLPVLDGIEKNLGPIIDKFADGMRNPDFIKGITEAASTAGKVIGMIGKFIANNPATVLTTIGLFEAAKWIINGVKLGLGFNSVASVGGGSGSGFDMGGKLGMSKGAGFKANFKGGLGSNITRLGGVVSAFTSGISEWSENKDAGMSTGKNITKSVTKGAATGLGAWGGASAGAAIGAFGGPIGMAIGGLIGGALGAWGGSELGEAGGDLLIGEPLNDFKSEGKKNNFTKDRAILQGGKIHPIDNKDSFIGMKPNGPVDKAIKNNSSSSMKIEFGEIKINFGEILVKSPGNSESARLLIKDPLFIRDLTNQIQAETKKIINQGKNKG